MLRQYSRSRCFVRIMCTSVSTLIQGNSAIDRRMDRETDVIDSAHTVLGRPLYKRLSAKHDLVAFWEVRQTDKSDLFYAALPRQDRLFHDKPLETSHKTGR